MTKTIMDKKNKWDTLIPQLENYFKMYINDDGLLIKPASVIIREFAHAHNTTESSASFYYYKHVKDKLFNDINKEAVPQEIEDREENVDNIDDSYSDDFRDMIDYIEESIGQKVSPEAESLIVLMVDNYGIIKTLVSISKAIRDIDKIDISYSIANYANRECEKSPK